MQPLRGILGHFIILLPSSILYFTLPAGASSGCGTQQDFIGQTRSFTIESGSTVRDYTIHLPKNYKVDTVQPLMIAYHGRTGDPDEFERATRFSDDAVNPEMIVVYPAGVKKAWEGASYAEPEVSDKLFTTDLISHIKSNFCVDESRIYATGFSNGGGFVGTLACSPEHGGHFAAFAAFAAALYTDVSGDEHCEPARTPLPLLELHGLEDPVVPYEGGDGNGGPLPSLPEWLSRWASRNLCNSSEATDLEVGGQHTKWSCKGIDGLQQHYNTTHLGHFWPAADSGLDISSIMIKFLSKQSKPSEEKS